MAFVTPCNALPISPFLNHCRRTTSLRSTKRLRVKHVVKTPSTLIPHHPIISSATQSEVTSDGDASTNDTIDDNDTPFPTLYDAWFKPDLQLSEQVQQSVSLAYEAGIREMELQWPVVPNLEEISAGTMLNFEFGKQVAVDLGMQQDKQYQLIKRYLASFCNVWWGIQVAKCAAFQNKTVWIVSTDNVSREKVILPSELSERIRFASTNKPPIPESDDDVVIIIDPRFNEVWKKCIDMKPKNGVVIFMNSQFSESYGLTGPRFGKLKNIQPVYFLKRITRGFVFYSYPNKWKACLENPDMSIEVVETYDSTPKLRDVSNAVRGLSNNRYGGFFNDRYVRGFGGRL